MLKRDSLILIVAAVSGLFSFVLIANYLKSSTVSKMRFVIAGRPLAKGQIIVKEDVSISKPMQSKAPDLLYLSADDVVGKTAKENISKDNLIHRSQLEPPLTDSAPVIEKKESLPIPAGMSVMTLAVKQVESVPEGIQLGCYVDILGTVVNLEGVRNIAPIVRGAQVISMDKPDGGDISSISVALTSNGALAVSKAIMNGKLNLILRSGSEEKEGYSAALGSIEIIRGVEKSKNARMGEEHL